MTEFQIALVVLGWVSFCALVVGGDRLWLLGLIGAIGGLVLR